MGQNEREASEAMTQHECLACKKPILTGQVRKVMGPGFDIPYGLIHVTPECEEAAKDLVEQLNEEREEERSKRRFW